MAPGAEILKRNRLPPSNWWAASSTVTISRELAKDTRPVKSKNPKNTTILTEEAVEVGERSVDVEGAASTSVVTRNELPKDARPGKSKSLKKTRVARSGPAEVDEEISREKKVGESSSGGDNGKRNRAPPSNWWAASLSGANIAPEPRKHVQPPKNKMAIETATAENGILISVGSSSGRGGLKSSKATGPRTDGNVETVNVNIADSAPTGSTSRSGRLERKRTRPSNWWEANTSSLLESDESSSQDVASRPQDQLKDTPEAANRRAVGKIGGPQSNRRNSNSRELNRRENDTEGKGKKHRRPPASQSAQNIEGRKAIRFRKGSRKERRQQSSGEEIIDVLTASSTFGKGRTKRSDRVIPTEGRSRPESSDQRYSTKGSKSSKTSKISNQTSSQVPATHSQTRQKKLGRSSGGRSSQSKRRAEEDPEDEVRGNKRHRSDQAHHGDESEDEEAPNYQQLIPVTRKVNQDVIEAKWDALPSGCIDLVADLLEATQRPVIARLKDENQRQQAKSALQLITRKLISKMKKGVPFPGAGGRSREVEFNFEKVIDRNRILEGQLTADVDANKLLNEALKKEIALLESEQETLVELETNARTESALRKQAERKTHPLLQSGAITSTSDLYDYTLGDIQSRLMPSLGNYKDDALMKVARDIESHVDSLNGNIMQLAGIPEAMAKAKAVVQVTLFDHLESTRYEDVVLGE